MIITIDGPAGAGKSTVARLLAARLGFQFLDTGAMYRAVTWAAINGGVRLDDPYGLTKLVEGLEFRLENDRVWVNGTDVTAEIRQPDVTALVSTVADTAAVREVLVERQRHIAAGGNFVCEGRDQGTVVFPDSPCKFYLTASSQERARRRVEQMRVNGQAASLAETTQLQNERDRRDLSRPVGRLMKASDAIEIITDGKLLGEVIDEVERIARDKLAALLKRET